jgi:hypothetical protein
VGCQDGSWVNLAQGPIAFELFFVTPLLRSIKYLVIVTFSLRNGQILTEKVAFAIHSSWSYALDVNILCTHVSTCE